MQVYLVLTIFGIWLIIISIVTFLQLSFVKKLTKGTNEADIVKVLKRILSTQDANSKELSEVRKELLRLERDGQGHVQKVGLIKFNPFRETGGDHSFSLAILNADNTGFIITGLHTRERTRLYLKEIISGKAETELSSEEIKAFQKAQKS